MAWLGGRVKWPFGSNGIAVAELEIEPEIEVVADGLPQLKMLAADASGLASFKLFSFATAEDAIEYIRRSFGDRSDTGLIAFWAMTEKPAVHRQPGADTALEVMVMIRDDIRHEVVYPFSFTDMETAQTFVQHEMQRGLDPANVLVYWAVPVQLGISADGQLGLFPKAAPISADPDTHEVTHAPVPIVDDLQEETGTAADFLQSLSVTVQGDAEFVSDEGDPIEEMFTSAADEVAESVDSKDGDIQDESEEFAGGGDETHGSAEQVADEGPDAFGHVIEEAADTDEDGFGETLGATESVEAPDADDAAEDLPDDGDDGFAEAADATESHEALAEEIEPTVDATPAEAGHEGFSFSPEPEFDTTAEPVAAIATQLMVRDEPAGTEFPARRAHAREDNQTDMVSDQLQRVLRVRRLEQSTEPFRGFQSPPGRF
jgi:hypothetical protein